MPLRLSLTAGLTLSLLMFGATISRAAEVDSHGYVHVGPYAVPAFGTSIQVFLRSGWACEQQDGVGRCRTPDSPFQFGFDNGQLNSATLRPADDRAADKTIRLLNQTEGRARSDCKQKPPEEKACPLIWTVDGGQIEFHKDMLGWILSLKPQ